MIDENKLIETSIGKGIFVSYSDSDHLYAHQDDLVWQYYDATFSKDIKPWEKGKKYSCILVNMSKGYMEEYDEDSEFEDEPEPVHRVDVDIKISVVER